MGNDQSVGMDGGLALQCQGAEHLWSLELNRGKSGEGEGVCVFTRTQGKGTQDNLCKAGLEVRRVHSLFFLTPAVSRLNSNMVVSVNGVYFHCLSLLLFNAHHA